MTIETLPQTFPSEVPAANCSLIAHSRFLSVIRSSQSAIILLAVLVTSSLLPAAEAPVPLPDEDVMHPTDHGLRMTPEIARALGGLWIKSHVGEDLDLSPGQVEQLNAAAGNRLMHIALERPIESRQFWEYAIESMLATRGRFTPEMRLEFAQRLQPLLPGLHEFHEGLAQDARPVLTPEQWKGLDERIEHRRRQIRQLEEQMEMWSQGLAMEDEQPVDIFSDRGEQDQDEQARALRHARRVGENSLSQLGPREWRRLLAAVALFFGFDASQSAAANSILDDYARQAAVVMTPEWKERVQRNRTMESLRRQLGGEPIGPWVFRLEQEYAADIEPLKELGHSFREEILALVTDEQRESALARVLQQAAAHGFSVDQEDVVLLGLAPQGDGGREQDVSHGGR